MNDKDFAKAVSEIITIDNMPIITSVDPKNIRSRARAVDRKKIDNKLVTYHQPRSMESEYFRFLKAKVEHFFNDTPGQPNEGRIILVTGATMGTGKTTCALNLALSFAKAHGNQVLFLDADSRHPASQVHLGLGKKPLPGFSDVLTMKRRAGDVIINTGLSGLIYFPSGDFSEQFIDRLRGEELAIIINSIRKRFKYIIIDTPPAFPMPEPGILAKYSDGVLIVLGAGKDGRDQLENTMESLKGAEILGVILNGVKSGPKKRYGSYGYYSRADKLNKKEE